MKIALYYPWVYLTSGAERIVLELTRRSRHRWTVFTNRFDRHQTFPELQELEIVELQRVSVTRSVGPMGQASWRILGQRLPLEGCDALVVLCDGLGDLAVFRNGGLPRLCICMTPLRIAFDPSYRERYLGARGRLDRALVSGAAALFRVAERLAWRRYDYVLCISEEVRRRARRGGLVSRGPCEVAYVGLGFEPEPEGATFEPFFLVPGRIMWTKNLELAIEAFVRARRSSPALAGFRLVIAGLVDEKSRVYLERLRALADGESGIEFRVFPSDGELRALYRSCYGVLFTAFNEDWGIVPIEAMAFGKPVIATDRGGPRESVQHGVNGFLEPPTVEAFAARIAELAEHPARARAIGAEGPARARQFTWDRFVACVDDNAERLASRASRSSAVAPAAGGALADGGAGSS